MTIDRLYIVGAYAMDVARLTNLPLGCLLDRKWKPTLHPNAVQPALRDLVYLDLTRLDWWDRWRVAWARIGAHQYVRALPKEEPCSQFSGYSSSGASLSPFARVRETTNDPPARRGDPGGRAVPAALAA